MDHSKILIGCASPAMQGTRTCLLRVFGECGGSCCAPADCHVDNVLSGLGARSPPSGSSHAEPRYLQVLQQQHTCAGTQAPSAYPAFAGNDWDCGRNGWTVAVAEDHTLLSCATHGPYALGATTNYRITWSNSSRLNYHIKLGDLK